MKNKIFLVLALIWSSASANAQLITHVFESIEHTAALGSDVQTIQDVNGDSIPDILVGSSSNDLGGFDAGRIQVFSGSNGAIIHDIVNNQPGTFFGSDFERLGDVDGDGYDEYLVRTWTKWDNSLEGHGAISVFSTKTGNILYRVDGTETNSRFGLSMAAGSDFNNDLIPDFATIDYWDNTIKVFSGTNGLLISNIPLAYSQTTASNFASLAVVNDLDGDLVPDFMVNISSYSATTPLLRVHAISSSSGALIHSTYGFQPQDSFGGDIRAIADITGDGKQEIAIGASQYKNSQGSTIGAIGIYNGSSLDLIDLIIGEENGLSIGAFIKDIGDVSGDGVSDFLSYGSSSVNVRVFSGSDLSIIANFSKIFTGTQISVSSDINGDNFPDAFYGNYTASQNGPYSGSLWAVSGIDKSVLFIKNGELSSDSNLGETFDISYNLAGNGRRILIADRENDQGTNLNTGEVSLYSLNPISLIRTHNGSSPNENLGIGASFIGDINSDQVDDYAVSSLWDPPGDTGSFADGRLDIYSGINGQLIHQTTGDEVTPSGGSEIYHGNRVGGLGDVNGDNVPDYWVASRKVTNPGTQSFYVQSIDIKSGANHSVIAALSGSANGTDFFGKQLVNIGDINADGKPEIALSSPYFYFSDPENRQGKVEIYSGANYNVLYTIYGQTNAYLGYSITNAGDQNGDGIKDLLVSAPFESPSGQSSRGSVTLISGANGQTIWKIFGENNFDYLGFVIDTIKDINSDGKREIVASIGYQDRDIKVLSSINQTLIYEITNPPGYTFFGANLRSLGDIEGDGFQDLAVGHLDGKPSQISIHSLGQPAPPHPIGSTPPVPPFYSSGSGTSGDNGIQNPPPFDPTQALAIEAPVVPLGDYQNNSGGTINNNNGNQTPVVKDLNFWAAADKNDQKQIKLFIDAHYYTSLAPYIYDTSCKIKIYGSQSKADLYNSLLKTSLSPTAQVHLEVDNLPSVKKSAQVVAKAKQKIAKIKALQLKKKKKKFKLQKAKKALNKPVTIWFATELSCSSTGILTKESSIDLPKSKLKVSATEWLELVANELN
ncbi:MAG: hypothetical protein H6619_00485 [Deltaproteobacteria bacterium]|nr:hypothetical protein [Deltaproteobacteria bacterium]